MLVRFLSSETGEVLMFAETAKPLLEVIGKETTARGTFTPDEMSGAAKALQEAVERSEEPPPDDVPIGEDGAPIILFRQRAWPLIDMLERTAKAGPDANIVWEAAAPF